MFLGRRLCRAEGRKILLYVERQQAIRDIAMPKNKSLRFRIYAQLEPSVRKQPGLSNLNCALVAVILIATLSAILETEPMLAKSHAWYFQFAEMFFGSIFCVEYASRIWTAAEVKPNESAWGQRLKFVLSLSGLVDLMVLIATFSPFFVVNIAALRLLRLVRILRLVKLGRMSLAMRRLQEAVHSRRYELGLTMGLALGLLIFGATALYWIEGELQPDKFGSIPRALWWAVITMTTIGYGDVYPITVAGKIVAAFVAVAGIGLIAMPTGILAAAFSDAMQKEHDEL